RATPAAERLAELLAVRRQLSAEKVAAENASSASIPTAYVHARGWAGPGLHIDCDLARARRHDPQAGCCVGRRRSLCFREWYAQGKAVHLGRSCERPPGALHGGDERQ